MTIPRKHHFLRDSIMVRQNGQFWGSETWTCGRTEEIRAANEIGVEGNIRMRIISVLATISAIFSQRDQKATSASSNRRVSSSDPAGRGDSLVTRCCGRVPSTNAGISAEV